MGFAKDLALILTLRDDNQYLHATDWPNGGTPLLFEAIMMGEDSVEAVKIVFTAVEQIDREHVIPIVLTVTQGYTNIIKTLVDNGADPYNFRRQDGKGLLTYALTRLIGVFIGTQTFSVPTSSHKALLSG